MKLTAYLLEGHRLDIRPAPVERDWMEATNERFAYRCLPLNIANAYGWEILCPAGFAAAWSGRPDLDAVKVEADPWTIAPALSHFGHGTLTFHIPCVFRTEPGFDLFVQGPINRPKDGIAPLSGIVETDWAPFTFTMNWLFTRPDASVRFEQGEPFCHIFPVRRGEIESIEPQVRPMADDPELAAQYALWKESRAQFNADLKVADSQAQADRWQKNYYRGLDAGAQPAAADGHRTRVRLSHFSAPDAAEPKPEP
jgi:hypothetical protein